MAYNQQLLHRAKELVHSVLCETFHQTVDEATITSVAEKVIITLPVTTQAVSYEILHGENNEGVIKPTLTR